MSNTIQSTEIQAYDLKTIAAEQPSSFVVSDEPGGGGARIYGPFATQAEANQFAEADSDFGFGERRALAIDAAVAEFCDED